MVTFYISNVFHITHAPYLYAVTEKLRFTCVLGEYIEQYGWGVSI